MATILHDVSGLIQENHRNLYAEYTRVIRSRLPLHLSLLTWIAYGYTAQDVRKSLMHFDTKMCLHCMRTIIPPDSVGPNLSYKSVNFCSKSIIVDRILSEIESTISCNTKSVLTSNHFPHRPPLPVIDVDCETFSQCQAILISLSMVKVNIAHHLHYALGRCFVLVDQIDSEILGYRVVPRGVFLESMRYHRHSPINHSVHVEHNGIDYICTEEAAVFRLISF